MEQSPYKITIYDKTFTRVGWINDPVAIEVTPRHMAIGTAVITVASNHRQLPNLAADGTRMTIDYYGERLMSGYVQSLNGTGPVTGGQIAVTIQDDIWLLWRMLSWPVPTAVITAQGVKMDTRSGPAETVAKGYISDNKAHLLDNITVVPSAGRGATVNISSGSRMAVLADFLIDPVDKAGIGISVGQVGAGLSVDCYAPKTYPQTLSEDGGTVLSWGWTSAAATATRTIVGGPNEDTSREFRQVISTAMEARTGYSIETFTDARDALNYAGMDDAGNKALDTAINLSGFKVELSESTTFRYGGTNGVHVGDKVTIRIGDTTFTDVLREATLVFNFDDGPKVTPTVGEHTDDPDRLLATRLAALAKGIRDLRTR